MQLSHVEKIPYRYDGRWTVVRLGVLSGVLVFVMAAVVAVYLHRVAVRIELVDLAHDVKGYAVGLEQLEALRQARDRALVFSALSAGCLGFAVGYVRHRALNAHGARQRAVEQMQRSEQRFRQLAEAAHDAVCTLDEAGKVLFWNRAAAHLFGLSSYDVQNKGLEDLIFPEVSRGQYQQCLKQLSHDTQDAGDAGEVLELLVRKRDGDTFFAELSFSTMWVDGHWQGVVMMRDVSRHKREQATLRRALESAEQAHHALQKSHRKLERAMHRANDLALLASTPPAELVCGELDMKKVINQAITRLDDAIMEAGAAIGMTAQLPPAQGHAQWVEELWYSFIVHALEEGGQKPFLEIGSHQDAEKQRVVYWLRDNGTGMSEAQKAALFTSDEKNAHGFGLALLQRVLAKLDCEIWVEGALGKGNAYFISMPS